MGSAAYAELGTELEARGLRYVNTDVPTGVAYGDGRALVAARDPQVTVEGFGAADAAAFLGELDRFGAMADEIGTLLSSELMHPGAIAPIVKLGRRLGARDGLATAAFAVQSARDWLHATFEGPEPGLLYAPWVLHTGLEPSAAGGALQLLALAGGLHLGGMPVVEGGSARFVEAFERLIGDHGGTVRTGADVERIEVSDGRATGVVAGGERIEARRAVIASVTPTQLYGRLLDGARADGLDAATDQAARFRYGRGAMQIHPVTTTPSSSGTSWRSASTPTSAAFDVFTCLEHHWFEQFAIMPPRCRCSRRCAQRTRQPPLPRDLPHAAAAQPDGARGRDRARRHPARRPPRGRRRPRSRVAARSPPTSSSRRSVERYAGVPRHPAEVVDRGPLLVRGQVLPGQGSAGGAEAHAEAASADLPGRDERQVVRARRAQNG